jgi:hypothetical protein
VYEQTRCGPCQVKTDSGCVPCERLRLHCRDGRCISPPPPRCKADSECGACQTCKEGQCVPPSPCPEGSQRNMRTCRCEPPQRQCDKPCQMLQNGRCVACSELNMECKNGKCVSPQKKECTVGQDQGCGPCRKCRPTSVGYAVGSDGSYKVVEGQNGQCVTCAEVNMECKNGKCVAKEKIGGKCRSDNDCGSGYVCQNGTCRRIMAAVRVTGPQTCGPCEKLQREFRPHANQILRRCVPEPQKVGRPCGGSTSSCARCTASGVCRERLCPRGYRLSRGACECRPILLQRPQQRTKPPQAASRRVRPEASIHAPSSRIIFRTTVTRPTNRQPPRTTPTRRPTRMY